MKKIICLSFLVIFFFRNGTVFAAWNPISIPVTFYTATRPNQPMTWYPETDPECFLYPFCQNFFYAPNIVFENGKYRMWTTVDDMIFYFESTDGKTWTNGKKLMSGIQTNWENDANCRNVKGTAFKCDDPSNNCVSGKCGDCLCGGMSNPVVVKGVTSGWTYTMYYTAGPTVNTPANGGLGVAFSNDGINWTRFSGNPIRRFVGGGTFATNAMKIGDKRYVFFYGGGKSLNGNPTEAADLRAAEDLGNGTNLGTDKIIFPNSAFTKTAYPIAYDTGTKSCWMYNRGIAASDWLTNAGPTNFQIYKGSDCFNTLGTKVAQIGPELTGNKAQGIAGTGIKERDGNGQVVPGANSLQFYFPAVNDATWGWHPASVILSRSVSNQPIGVLNEVNCQTADGWALDENSPGNPIDIHFYFDVLDVNHFLGATKASLEWPGICAYDDLNKPPCSDNHKYIYNIPTKLKDGKPHQVYAFGINLPGTPGQNAPLTNSPKTITCQSIGTNITNLRQLLAAFSTIFNYNQLVANFGK